MPVMLKWMFMFFLTQKIKVFTFLKKSVNIQPLNLQKNNTKWTKELS